MLCCTMFEELACFCRRGGDNTIGCTTTEEVKDLSIKLVYKIYVQSKELVNTLVISGCMADIRAMELLVLVLENGTVYAVDYG